MFTFRVVLISVCHSSLSRGRRGPRSSSHTQTLQRLWRPTIFILVCSFLSIDTTSLFSSFLFSWPVIPIALILLRVAYAQAKRFLPSRSSKHKQMSYVVKWGRERYSPDPCYIIADILTNQFLPFRLPFLRHPLHLSCTRSSSPVRCLPRNTVARFNP